MEVLQLNSARWPVTAAGSRPGRPHGLGEHDMKIAHPTLETSHRVGQLSAVTHFVETFRHWHAGRSPVQIHQALGVDRKPSTSTERRPSPKGKG